MSVSFSTTGGIQVRLVSFIGFYGDMLLGYSQIEFGSGTCSQYLLSTSPFHLQVWDLLSCAGKQVGVVSTCCHAPVLCRELARGSVCS